MATHTGYNRTDFKTKSSSNVICKTTTYREDLNPYKLYANRMILVTNKIKEIKE